MVHVDLDTFSGPITAVAINEWLLGCEKAFDLWNDDNGPPNLTEKRMVDSAGNHISKKEDDPTHDLADWWKNTQNISTWSAFKDALKEEALRPGWRGRALQAFYTTKQDEQSAHDYIRAFDENRSVIKNGVNSTSQLKAVDDFVYKCLLLFHAAPGVATTVMDSDFDIVKATLNEVKDKIQKNSTATGVPVPLIPAGVSGYLLLDEWGVLKTPFSDLDKLPRDSKVLGAMTDITIWSNGDSTRPMIQSYKFQFSGSITLSNPPSYFQVTSSQLTFGAGEYITTVKIAANEYQYAQYSGYPNSYLADSGVTSISYMGIFTSNNPPNSVVLGNPSPSKTSATFKAPVGWRIVGFRGSSHSYTDYSVSGNTRYPIVGIAAILAPIPT